MLKYTIFASLIAICLATGPAMIEAGWFSKPGLKADEIAISSPAVVARVETPAPLSGGRVSITADNRGHFITTFELNGKRIEAMVDTGASVVVINRTQARRLGYSLNASDFVHRVNTANGSINAASISLREVKIDRIRIRDVQAVVLDDAALTNALIGMSFLRQLASYEFRDGTLFLNQ
jgi:aspartyl protease family protein